MKPRFQRVLAQWIPDFMAFGRQAPCLPAR
jgi:hypothetical protein